MSAEAHRVSELLDHLFKKAYVCYRSSTENPMVGGIGVTHLETGKIVILTGCEEVDAACLNANLNEVFTRQWAGMRDCLHNIANWLPTLALTPLSSDDQPKSAHRACSAGFGCLLRDCTKPGATSLRFAEACRSLMELTEQPGPLKELPSILERFTYWLSGSVTTAYNIVAEPSVLSPSRGGRQRQHDVIEMPEPIDGTDVASRSFCHQLEKVLTVASVGVALITLSLSSGIGAYRKEWWETGILWLILVGLSVCILLSKEHLPAAALCVLGFTPLAGHAAITAAVPFTFLLLSCCHAVVRFFAVSLWMTCCLVRIFVLKDQLDHDTEKMVMVFLIVHVVAALVLVLLFVPFWLYRICDVFKAKTRGDYFIPVVKSLVARYDFEQSEELLGLKRKIAAELKRIGSVTAITSQAELPMGVQVQLESVAEAIERLKDLSDRTVEENVLATANQAGVDQGLLPANNLLGTWQEAGVRSGASTDPDPGPQELLTPEKLRAIFNEACKSDRKEPCGGDLAVAIREDSDVRSQLGMPRRSQDAGNIEKTLCGVLAKLDELPHVSYTFEQFSALFGAYSQHLVTVRSMLNKKKYVTVTGEAAEGSSPAVPKVPGTAAEIHFGTVGKLVGVRCPTVGGIDDHLGVVLLDSSASTFGNVLAWNGYMNRTSGVKEAEITGQPCFELLTTQRDQEALTHSIKKALTFSGGMHDTLKLSLAAGVGGVATYSITVAPFYARSSGEKKAKGGDTGKGVDVGKNGDALRGKRGAEEECKGVALFCTLDRADSNHVSTTKQGLFQWFLEQVEAPINVTQRDITKQQEALRTMEYTREDFAEFIYTLAQRNHKLLELTHQIQPLSSLSVFHHPMDLRKTFWKLMEDHEVMAKENGVFLELVIDDDLPAMLYADTEKLPQSIGYLIQHGIAHNYRGGIVTLTLSAEQHDTQSIGSFVLCVKDNGPGIPQNKLKTLFEPGNHWNNDPANRTWSFGLCNVKIVVEEMGGILSVQSEAGVSTEFSITLPLMRGETDDVTNIEPGDTQGTQYTVLIMEPSNILRSSICAYFWKSKYAVLLANTTADIIQNLGKADVLLLSVQPRDLSAMNEVLENLGKHPDVEVIVVLTEETMERAKIAVKKSAMKQDVERLAFLIKPFHFSKLRKIMGIIVERHKRKASLKKDIAEIRKALTERSLPWKRGALLGQGTFGKVYEAKQISGGVVAVKICTVKDNAQIKKIIKEITVMTKLHHPNIIHYFYCEKKGDELHLFMEYARGGSLAHKIHGNNKTPLNMPLIVQYTSNILSGLEFLHGKGVVHRDLKPANILLTNDNVCKIADFGCALSADSKFTPDFSTNGTVLYMAPEVLRGLKHDSNVDIWSFGCVLMELVSGNLPFKHIGGMMQVLKANLASETEDPDIGDVDAVFRSSIDAHDLVQLCLRTVPTARLPAREISSHPFFSLLVPSPEEEEEDGGELPSCAPLSLGIAPPFPRSLPSTRTALAEALTDAAGEGPSANTLNTVTASTLSLQNSRSLNGTTTSRSSPESPKHNQVVENTTGSQVRLSVEPPGVASESLGSPSPEERPGEERQDEEDEEDEEEEEEAEGPSNNAGVAIPLFSFFKPAVEGEVAEQDNDCDTATAVHKSTHSHEPGTPQSHGLGSSMRHSDPARDLS